LGNNSYRFKIGNFEAMVIRDTTGSPEWDKFFPTVDPEEFNQTFEQYGFTNRDVMEITCLLVRTEKHLILIDTGWGVRLHVTGNLFQNLESEGIRREEIDIVINSHAHPDHVGGNTDAEGNPAFPNARYIICREEWDFWTSEPSLSQIDDMFKPELLDAVQKGLVTIKDRFELVDAETEILPGFETLKAPGHTPGQIVLTISSGKECLFCIFDIAHHPVQLLRPSWTIPLDIQPEQAISTRRQFLSQKLPLGDMIFACHFPFPGLGQIATRDDGWHWQPGIT
jgi:glyoxylase-like metal-dependent hydrolase (beta-lactamase superfamily II)